MKQSTRLLYRKSTLASAALVVGAALTSCSPTPFQLLHPTTPTDNGNGVRTAFTSPAVSIDAEPRVNIGDAVAITRSDVDSQESGEERPLCSEEEIVLTSEPVGCDVLPGQVLVLLGECTDSGTTFVAHNGRTYCFDVDY